ncbi:MAG: hypothetical protein QNL51_15060 [Opitutaceae bacterium]
MPNYANRLASWRISHEYLAMLDRISVLGALFAILSLPLWSARPFTVAVYNVENLHDADGVAVYDDYQPDVYTPAHVATKATNAAKILQKFRGGEGPDIILLQEIEIDQTPDSRVDDIDAFMAKWRGSDLKTLLGQSPLPAELAGVPAEVWLLKALADVGLTGYEMAVGSDAPSPPPTKSGRAIKCVTLSKFPIVATRQHSITSARMILETEIEIDGARVYVFNNHWKSGAGTTSMERIRVQNAEVLRDRLDVIFAEDPLADVIIGGDLNSQYNQKLRYPKMPRTGVDDVLRVGYSESELRRGDIDLHNLWYELEEPNRGSDVYRGEWGTLMHLIVSRGLHNWSGIQYQDNSFKVARVPGLNADIAGAPIRWSSGGSNGSGFSDHLPIYAHFRSVDQGLADKWMPVENPADTPASTEVWRVDYAAADLNGALRLDALPKGTDLRDGSWTGKLFRVNGAAIGARNPKVRFGGAVYGVYASPPAAKDLLEAQAVRSRALSFYGELGTYKGDWQFVVRDVSWVQ